MLECRLERSSGTAAEYAYDVLKENILLCRLAPGEKLCLKDIEPVLGISRTPLKNAVVKLQEDGLLEVFPQRGTLVSLIKKDRILEALSLRTVIEQMAVKRLCAHRLAQQDFLVLEENLNLYHFYFSSRQSVEALKKDLDFHRWLMTSAQMHASAHCIARLSLDLDRLRFLKLKSDIRMSETYDEHRTLLDALKEQDADTACEILSRHIAKMYDDLAILLQTYPEYFDALSPSDLHYRLHQDSLWLLSQP